MEEKNKEGYFYYYLEWHTMKHYLNVICLNVFYLLYVSDVHQLDNFILLGRGGSGAGALKAQIADGEEERKKPA